MRAVRSDAEGSGSCRKGRQLHCSTLGPDATSALATTALVDPLPAACEVVSADNVGSSSDCATLVSVERGGASVCWAPSRVKADPPSASAPLPAAASGAWLSSEVAASRAFTDFRGTAEIVLRASKCRRRRSRCFATLSVSYMEVIGRYESHCEANALPIRTKVRNLGTPDGATHKANLTCEELKAS
jgi:hypothetical protein